MAKKFHGRESNPGALACEVFSLSAAPRQQTWKKVFKIYYLKLFLCDVLPLDAIILHLVIPTLSYLVITSVIITYSLKGATFIKFLEFPMRRLFENHIFFKSLTTIIKNYDKPFVNILQKRTTF